MSPRIACDEDVAYGLASGLYTARLAREVGCSRASIYRAQKRVGTSLPTGAPLRGLASLRDQVADMAPLEAVECLLSLIDRMVPDRVGEWPGIDLTPTQRTIFATVYACGGRLARYERVIGALYPNPDDKPGSASDVVKVSTFKLRQKIAGTGARIVTVWGSGFRFERDPGVVFPWEADQ